MMAEKRPGGLGRGLSALIGDKPAASDAPPKGTRQVPVAFLRPNRFQPRKHFAESDLADLAASVREKGVLQPILVRPVAGEPQHYEIVAGERRWRAAQRAKLHEVPVVVREMSDGESLEIAIIENVQRADLNAIEEAAAYSELIERFSYTQDQLAEQVGKSRPHVANTLRLLKLPAGVKAMVQDGRLSAGHARTLIGRDDAEARALAIVEAGLNVREAERRAPAKAKIAKGAAPRKDPDTLALEQSLTNMLGLKVEIVARDEESGHLSIAYKNLEQLDDLIRRLNRPR